VKLLADTHIILWAAIAPEKLSRAAATALKDESNQLFFSATSIWEVAIKSALNKKDFNTDARLLYRGLLDAGYIELPVTSEHAVAVSSLPSLHKDPFDRILIAQATVEGITLLTSDRQVAKYPGPIRKV
jgi:PIN domain nuclease of toxin-antitoxin system